MNSGKHPHTLWPGRDVLPLFGKRKESTVFLRAHAHSFSPHRTLMVFWLFLDTTAHRNVPAGGGSTENHPEHRKKR